MKPMSCKGCYFYFLFFIFLFLSLFFGVRIFALIIALNFTTSLSKYFLRDEISSGRNAVNLCVTIVLLEETRKIISFFQFLIFLFYFGYLLKYQLLQG